jgi:A/G-specific adenine glycosylase
VAIPPSRRAFNRALTRWHASHRRELAVRRTGDPWAILVAEVMSQQTQIDRVGPAWERFIARWPDATSLATAGTQELLRAWAGLGYNRRALALREAARMIVRRHGGRVPASVDALELLPGIGPYTACAVAASAFGVPVAPLDVNVRRIVGRVVGSTGDSPGARRLQATADALVARHDPRGWVDAMMDLAATVCRPRSPRCGECPLTSLCQSRGRSGESERRPAPRTQPFAATNRWLRGRLLAVVRDAPPGTWVVAPERLGEHDSRSITNALRALERDGFVQFGDGRVRINETSLKR